jgi:hypothetical protein
MKLRTSTIILSLLFIAELIFLILNKGNMSITSEPYSALGNLSENYTVFLVVTTILFIGLALVIKKMYSLMRIKNSWEIYIFPLLGIITLLIPYRAEVPVSRTIHTVLGIITALLLVWIIITFNKKYCAKKGFKQFFSKYTPALMFFGTLILFLVFGLNAIMEIYYSIVLVLWINIVNFNLENETSSKTTTTRKK